MRDGAFAILVCVVCLAATPARAEPARYGLGRPPTPEELRALDISVAPTGAGLPPGRGTARAGRARYATLCALCHGARGEGVGAFSALAGGRGTLSSARPLLTVGSYWPYATTLWDYIRRGMPYLTPGTLGTDDVYALTAFVLHLNGIVDEDAVLTETTLPRVQMPNRDGFVGDPRPDVPR